MIGTHNSATGEKGLWFCWLLTPFAKCQSKTISEQFFAGCRIFDLRVKRVFGKWRCAHGLWYTKRTFHDILTEICELSENSGQDVYVTITYEGRAKNSENILFEIGMLQEIEIVRLNYHHVHIGPVSAKYSDDKGIKVEYKQIVPPAEGWLKRPTLQKFLTLDGRSWHTYLPIPWLWKKIYYNKVEINENEDIYVDFL